MKKLNLFILVSFFVIGFYGGVCSSQTLIFSDSFEYSDSPSNHGWDITLGSAPGLLVETSTDKSFDGDRSLYLDRWTTASHSMNEISASSVSRISLYYYDDMLSGFNWDVDTNVKFDNSTQNLHIWWYNQSDYQLYINGQQVGTGVTRTLGWHHFEWVIENNKVSAFIDETEVASDVLTISTISAVVMGIGTESGLYGYFDKVEVFSAEPPTRKINKKYLIQDQDFFGGQSYTLEINSKANNKKMSVDIVLTTDPDNQDIHLSEFSIGLFKNLEENSKLDIYYKYRWGKWEKLPKKYKKVELWQWGLYYFMDFLTYGAVSSISDRFDDLENFFDLVSPPGTIELQDGLYNDIIDVATENVPAEIYVILGEKATTSYFLSFDLEEGGTLPFMTVYFYATPPDIGVPVRGTIFRLDFSEGGVFKEITAYRNQVIGPYSFTPNVSLLE